MKKLSIVFILIVLCINGFAQTNLKTTPIKSVSNSISLKSEIEPNNDKTVAMQVVLGDTVNGAISPINDIDYYSFNGVQGDTISVLEEKRGTSQLYGRIRFLNQDGNSIFDLSQSYGEDRTKIRLVYVLPYTGKYYIRFSYWQNFSGIPQADIQRILDEDKKQNPDQLGPQLGVNDEGEYSISFTKFKKEAPVVQGVYLTDVWYNSFRFGSSVHSNGLPTKVTVEYGLTAALGNSIILTDNMEGIGSYPYGSPNSIIIDATPNTIYFYRAKAENSKGVYHSQIYSYSTPNTSFAFEKLNSTSTNQLRTIDFFDANNGAMGSHSTMLVTKNGGATWTNMWTPVFGSFDAGAVDQVTANKIVFVGSEGKIIFTNDGGANWIQKQLPNVSWIRGVHFLNDMVGVVCNYAGQVYKTIDGGNTWVDLVTNNSDGMNSIQILNENTIVAVGWNRRVLRTTNNGATWTGTFIADNSCWLVGVSFIDQNVGLAVDECGRIFKSFDGGITWTEKMSGMWLRGVKFISNSVAYAVGGNGTILKSINAGDTWESIPTGTYNALWNLSSIGSSNIMVVGDNGTLMKSASYVLVKSPNGGENWKAGTQKNITWSSGGVESVKIEHTADNGISWNVIAASVPSNGSYLWTVPNNVGTQNKIRLTSTANASLTDVSDGTFEIYNQLISFENITNSYITSKIFSSDIINGSANSSNQIPNQTILFYKTNLGRYGKMVILDCNQTLRISLTTYNQDGTVYKQKENLAISPSWHCDLDEGVQSDPSAANTNDFWWSLNTEVERYFRPENASGFNIYGIPDYLKIAQPNGGENFKVGTQKNITWTSSSSDNVKIEHTANNGSSWNVVAASAPSTGSYLWTVPNNVGTQNKIRITSTANASLTDVSDGVFNIVLPGAIAEIEPNNLRDASAMSVSYSDTVNAAISPINDVDYYRISGAAGDTLMVNAETRGTSQLWGRLRLVDQNGNWYRESTDYANTSFKQRIVYVLPYTGEYWLRYSFRDNTSGIPSAVLEEEQKDEKPTIEKGPQLGINDEGEYRISFDTFKKSAPIAINPYVNDINNNTVRFGGSFYPNGLPTKATVEYGTTTSYGSSVVIITDANSYDSWGMTGERVAVQPNTLYNYRLKVENALGTSVSGNYTFTTPSAPVGWVAQNSGTTNLLYAVDFFNESKGIAVGDQRNLRLTNDGGVTWIDKYPSGQRDLYLRAVDYVSTNKIVAVGSWGVVFISNDGGTTWTEKLAGSCYLYGVSFFDENVGTVTNNCGEMYKTVDGGNTWSKLTLPTTDGLYTVKMLSATKIIAAGTNRRVLVSNDGGTTWNSQQLAGGWSRYWSMSFTDSNNGMLVGDGGMKAKTADGGATWTVLDQGGTHPSLYGVTAQSANEYTAVASSGIILKTLNGGTSWSYEITGTQNGLRGIALAGNKAVAVGSYGTVLKSTEYLRVVTPNGSENYKVGTQKNITWSSGGVDNVKIEHTINNGSSWNVVAASVPSSGSYLWTVPNNVGTQNKIKVTSTTNASLTDVSDAAFNIIPTGPIAEVEPNNLRDASAMSVSYSDTVNAAISPINDVDYYRISGAAGDTLMVNAETRGTSQLWGRVALINNSGNWMTDAAYGPNPNKQTLRYILPYTGEYWLRYSYRENFNGIPANVLEDEKKNISSNHPKLEPQLGINDEGEYRISFDTFKKSAPIVNNPWPADINYNTVRFGGDFYPNGLPTKATMEYGTTTNYGSSVVLTTNANSINMWGIIGEKVAVQPSTLYNYRLKVENALGSSVSGNYTFTTPAAPVGWVAQNSGTTGYFLDVDFIDANNGVAVSDYKGIFKTVDGGTNWANIFPNNFGDYYPRGVDYVTSSKIVVVGSGSFVFISNDGGTTWTTKQVGSYWINKVSFVDSNNGMLVNEIGQIFKTVDGGVNWAEKYNANYRSSSWSIKYYSTTMALAAGANGNILKSVDGGETWIDVMPDTWWCSGVEVIDINTYLVLAPGNTLLKTVNGGTSWTTLPIPGNYKRDLSFTDANNGVVVGENGEIYETKNGGVNWAQSLSGTYNTLQNVIRAGNKFIAVGGYGTVLKSTEYLRVVSPNGGENFKVGTQKNITWTSSSSDNVKIEHTINDGSSWNVVAASVPSTGSFMWTVPNSLGNQNKIRITSTTNASLTDVSDVQFNIAISGAIAEIEPNNDRSTAMVVTAYSDTVNAKIDPIGDLDYYRFDGVAGDTVSVYSEAINSSSLEGRLRLRDQNGNLLFENAMFANDAKKQRVVWVLPYTGIYYSSVTYINNTVGVPKTDDEENTIAAPQFGPQNGPTDQGDYRFYIQKFKKAAPVASYSYYNGGRYDQARIYWLVYPNGLPTTVKIQYGTTAAYGNELVISTTAAELNQWSGTTTLIGLQGNIQYHYKVVYTNSLGANSTSDIVFTTPGQPDGWTLQNSGTSSAFYAIDFYDQNNGAAVTNSQIAITSNGGTNWTLVTPVNIGSGGFRAVDYISESKIIVTGYGGTILTSLDKGLTWELKIVGPTTGYYHYGVSFIDVNTGVVGCNDGQVFKTIDGGTTWNSVKIPSSSGIYNIHMFNANTIYAVGLNSSFIKSNDGGTTWSEVKINTGSNVFYSLSFSNQNKGMAISSNQIYLTSDAGNTWSLLNYGTNTYNFSRKAVKMISDTEALAVSTNGVILKTQNNGTSWYTENSGTTDSFYGIASVNGTSFICGAYGTIMKSKPSNTVTFQVNMNVYEQAGIFNSTNDKVFLPGSFNSWNNTALIMTDPEKDKIYTATVPVPQNTTVSYKFFINSPNAPNGGWEATVGTEADYGNRKLDVATSNIVAPVVYFNNVTQIPNSDNAVPFFTSNQFKYMPNVTDDGKKTIFYSSPNSTGGPYDIFVADVTSGFGGINLLNPVTNNLGSRQDWNAVWKPLTNYEFYFTTDRSDFDIKKYNITTNTETQLKQFGGSGYVNIHNMRFNSDGTKFIADISQIGQIIVGLFNADGATSSIYEFSWNQTDYGYRYPDISPNNNKITYSQGNKIFVANIDGTNIQQIAAMPGAGVPRWSPDGTMLAFEGYGGASWDIWIVNADGTNLRQLTTNLRDEHEPSWDKTNHRIYFTSTRDSQFRDIFSIPVENPNQITWQTQIAIKDKDNTGSQVHTFGTASKATNGIDLLYGELALPPLPPTGVFDSRLALPTTPIEYSIKDFRADNLDVITWTVKFQPGTSGYPVTFTWDNTKLPEGSFLLKDEVTGTIVNVNMKSVGSYELTNSAISSLKIEYSKSAPVEFNVATGWNIISVPVKAANMDTKVLFPDYSSNTYGFNASYFTANQLENSKGYWIKYNSSKLVTMNGGKVGSNNIPVKNGWNMIGAYDTDVSIVGSSPAGIITSPIYGYDNAYKSTQSLKVGKGYWVKTNSDGLLNLGPVVVANIVAKENDALNKCAKIIISDAAGKQVVLYSSDGSINLNEYELPPVPPVEIADARFESQRTVEQIGEDGKVIYMYGFTYPVSLRVEGMSLRLIDRIGGKLLNVFVKDGSEFKIANSGITQLLAKAESLPTEFKLFQNYPNPFNPTTIIKYNLPEKSNVRINIYNSLGERVEELVSQILDAGYYEVEWNASRYSSGVYFYQIYTDKFTSVKKMLMIK